MRLLEIPITREQNESAPQDTSNSTDATNLLVVPEVEVKTLPTQDDESKQEVLEVPTYPEIYSAAPPHTLPNNPSSASNVSADKQTITEGAHPQTPILTTPVLAFTEQVESPDSSSVLAEIPANSDDAQDC